MGESIDYSLSLIRWWDDMLLRTAERKTMSQFSKLHHHVIAKILHDAPLLQPGLISKPELIRTFTDLFQEDNEDFSADLFLDRAMFGEG